MRGRLFVAVCAGVIVFGVAAASGAVGRNEVVPPAGTPDLSKMALRVTDLPAGAKVSKQGYVKTSDVAEYDRVFKEGSARIGKSRLAALESDITLSADADKAAFDFQQFRAAVSTKQGRQVLAKEFASEVGVPAKNVVVGTPVSLHVGDESLAVPVKIGTPIGSIRIVIAAHRTDRVLSVLTVAGGLNVTITASSAAVLAKPIAQHVHDGLQPVNTALPTIAGTTQVGQTLTAAPGTWTNQPATYVYAWQHCDATGANCVAIAGANQQTYVLQATDAGSTIRVSVTASTGVGAATATSVQTAVVVPAG